MMKDPKKNWGKRIVFDRNFIVYHLCLALFALSVLLLNNYLLIRYGRDQGSAIGLASDHPYFKFLSAQELAQTEILWKTAIFLVLGFFIAGIACASWRKRKWPTSG